jgi:general nucleoside transport system permease protein
LDTALFLLKPGLQLAAPLIFAGVGGLLSYRAGVFNIALEGFMLFAAFFSVSVAAASGSIWLGLAAGVLSAVLLAVVMGVATSVFMADEVIVGIALNLFSLGLTTYLLTTGGQGAGFIQLNAGLPVFDVPFVDRVPFFSQVINGRDPLEYTAWLSIPLAAFLLGRTKYGLQLRATGENPVAARAAGVRVGRIRFSTFPLSGFFAGLGGAELALGSVHLFSENMTSGRGIIAFAAVIFGGGAPVAVGIASVLFGVAQAVAGLLQLGSRFPPQFVLMVPYLLAMMALALGGWRRARRLFRSAAEPATETDAADASATGGTP